MTRKMLHMVEAREHLSGSESILTVFKQLYNGFGLAQIGDLYTLSKASAICGKEKSLFSSLVVDCVGYHILYGINFKFTGVST